ncbi:hypothetical protein ABPG72_003657 [Tetrahymena utriculariae]
MSISLRFVLCISIPIIIGVAISIFIQYKLLLISLMDWTYHNSGLYQFKSKVCIILFSVILISLSHNQISQQITWILCKVFIINSMQIQLIKAQNFRPIKCSMGNYDLKKCKDYQMKEQIKNFVYLDQWFHREILDYQKLPDQQQNLLQMNWRFAFYPKSVYTSLSNRRQNYGSSSYQDCIPGKHLLNFDPRCRGWYQLAMLNKGITFFSPYLQLSSFTIGISISQRFNDADDNNLSVYSFNLDITNLADRYFKDQDILDQNSVMAGYTVFFHKQTHTIFYHKDWDRKYGILNTWEDVEYNSTLYKFDQDQFSNFTINLQKILNSYGDLNQINFYQNSSSDDNFLYFEKGQKQFIALIFPIKVTSRMNAYQSTQLKEQKPFYMGRVHTDISNLIYQANFYIFGIFKNLCIFEVCIILALLVISLIHYFAILYFTIDIPIEFLCIFLKQFFIRDNVHQKQSSHIVNNSSNLSASRILSKALSQNQQNGEPQAKQKIQVGSYKKILLNHQMEQQKVLTPQTTQTRQKIVTIYDNSPKVFSDQLKGQRTKSQFNVHQDQQCGQNGFTFRSTKFYEGKSKNHSMLMDDKWNQTAPKTIQIRNLRVRTISQ